MSTGLSRYARHLLLPQVGEAGQRRLLETELRLEGDAGVVKVAERYLSRAGVRVGEGAIQSVASSDEVARVAGDPALEPAARALLGALAAVEAIRAALALPGRQTESVLLSSSSEAV
jgi:sulfur-carrier protein adenylyltransferase/sulfurtransferase